jgi:hypothetical protein
MICTQDFDHMFRSVNNVLINLQKGFIKPSEGTIEIFNIIGIPVSTCLYCGKKFYSSRKQIISHCDNISCKKSMRADRDRLRRVEFPKEVKEKDKIRQQRFRDKKKQESLQKKWN